MLRYVLLAMGGLFVLVAALHVVLGPQADALLGSNLSEASLRDPTLDSQNRFYGAAFLLYGAIFMYCSSNLSRYRDILSITIGVFFLAGLARLVSITIAGWPAWPVVVLLVIELSVPPILLIWLRQYSDDGSESDA